VTCLRRHQRGRLADRQGCPGQIVRPFPRARWFAIIHVLFGFDRADLDANAQAALASIVKQLREHPNITIHLEV
jgi:outer membrane protein OmpA-like peptidoglycan-associated protein